ncbi:MAG: tail fiber domain-containing protein [Crocinitomicaceae bacterium]
MKKVIFTAAMFLLAVGANAQLKVNAAGLVGLHTTTPDGSYSVTIDQIPNVYSNGGSLKIRGWNQNLHLGSYTNNAIIGSSTGDLTFYDPVAGYNCVHASHYYVNSDERIKQDIVELETGLEIIMKLRGVSYLLKNEVERGTAKATYGFISQEVAKFLPEITAEQMEVLSIDYIQIIPFLVKGMQEQQAQIESKDEMIASLQEEINELKTLLYQFAESAGIDLNDKTSKPAAVLHQNQPNPFKERTVIKYELPENCGSASIMIFDMTGEMLEMYPVSSRDGGALTIEGKQYKPGMYLYSLIVDDVEVDTKRMILSK